MTNQELPTLSIDLLDAVTGGTLAQTSTDLTDNKGLQVDSDLGSWLKKNNAITAR